MDIKTLAEIMNVDVIDVEMLLNSIVNSIKKDKVTDCFIGATEKERVEITEAYMMDAVKKFQQFCVEYITNQDKNKSFNEYMFTILKNS